jgi:hypothetical protein
VALTYTIRAEDLYRDTKRLDEATRAAIAKAQVKAAKESLALLRLRTLNTPPASPNGEVGAVASGKFLRGWRISYSGRQVILSNVARHAVFVEGGRRPGARPPPSSALLAWVTLKLGLTGKQAQSAAFLIARAIGRRGLRPRPVMTAPSVQRSLLAIHRRALYSVLSRTQVIGGR